MWLFMHFLFSLVLQSCDKILCCISISNTSCFINSPFIQCVIQQLEQIRGIWIVQWVHHWFPCTMIHSSGRHSSVITEKIIVSTFRHLCGQYPSFFCLPPTLWFSPPVWPLEIKMVNLQGWRTGQVGWPSAAWPWAGRRQSEGAGLSLGLWRGD